MKQVGRFGIVFLVQRAGVHAGLGFQRYSAVGAAGDSPRIRQITTAAVAVEALTVTSRRRRPQVQGGCAKKKKKKKKKTPLYRSSNPSWEKLQLLPNNRTDLGDLQVPAGDRPCGRACGPRLQSCTRATVLISKPSRANLPKGSPGVFFLCSRPGRSQLI